MSESTDSKEPEPVRLPAQPPTDTRADFGPLDEDSEIRGKHFAWNEEPCDSPVETTRDPEPEEEADDSE